MKCPKCGAERDRVVDTRESRAGDAVRRRRVCGACGHRFTTHERVDRNEWSVVKRDGREEPFREEKLKASIRVAAAKRPVSEEQISSLASAVARELKPKYPEQVPAQAVGEALLARLGAVDEVAYLRYASIFRRFRDAGQFAAEARRLRLRGRR
jgi:transcriptional repressor NrdR